MMINWPEPYEKCAWSVVDFSDSTIKPCDAPAAVSLRDVPLCLCHAYRLAVDILEHISPQIGMEAKDESEQAR